MMTLPCNLFYFHYYFSDHGLKLLFSEKEDKKEGDENISLLMKEVYQKLEALLQKRDISDLNLRCRTVESSNMKWCRRTAAGKSGRCFRCADTETR